MIRQVDTGNAGPDLWADQEGHAIWSDGEPVTVADLAGEDGDFLAGIIAQEGLRLARRADSRKSQQDLKA